jgi:glycine/D-amino acid oxidase-like deaminating enzyme
MQSESYDLVVIGGGPAGISGANTASIFGKRVALVERLREVGGAGINTGTIPSHIGLLAMSGSRAELFNRTCFNYPTLGNLHKYATYEAILKRDGLVAGERK